MTRPSQPTDNAPEAYRILRARTKADYDKAYADLMVSGLKDAIAVIEKASTDYNDPEIQNLATTTLPDMRTHLDYFIDCQKKSE